MRDEETFTVDLAYLKDRFCEAALGYLRVLPWAALLVLAGIASGLLRP